MPRGKKNAIEQLINTKYAQGHETTVADLANEIGCTVQNVYIYFRKNPSRFSQIRRGVYKINPASSHTAISSSNSSIEAQNIHDDKVNNTLTFGTINES
jgi:hypothetical protein